jgi:putative PEP-CTERM system histidine kinase
VNAVAVFAFVSAFLDGAFALTAFLRARRSFAHWPFAAGMAILAFQDICSGLAESAQSPGEALLLQQRRLMALFLIPGIWVLFSVTYARERIRGYLDKRLMLFVTTFVLPLAIAVFWRNYLVAPVPTESGYSLGMFRLGWAGVFLYAYTLIGSVLVLMNLERTYRAAVGTMRWRIKFMLIGIGLLFAVRIYTSSQALVYRRVDLSVESLNSGAMLVASLLLVGSFLRAGDFEVDVYPSQLVLQNSITVLVAGVYLVLVGSLAKVVAYLGGDTAFALKAFLGLIALVVLVLILQSDRARLQVGRFVSRNFQRPLYDYRNVWRTFTEGTASRVEQGELCRSLVKMTAEMFQSLSVALWLVDEKRDALNLAASTFLSEARGRESGLKGSDADLIISHFNDRREPVDIESSVNGWASALKRIHPSAFPNGGHRVCVPLIGQGEIIGLISIGDRVGGVPFTLQDFDVLKCIGDHATASLQNVQLSEKLLQAKELEAFQTMAAFFAHDLKNAASTLNLMLQNLPVHFDDPEFRADSLRGISKTVTHINHLIGRLSLIRRELRINRVESDLNQVVASAFETFKNGPDLLLSKDLSPLPKIMIDPDQMLKVVVNLLLNATEAVPAEGRVRIETKLDSNWVVLTVADNGCGMNGEFMRNGLFRPFQTTKKNGLGIGMFQSKMIVEAHGGRIAVASEQGNGTTFQVFLPVVAQTK